MTKNLAKKITIKTTEITWRQKVIEDYVFMVQVIEDGSCVFSRKYANALQAVSSYNKFVDHGTCRETLEVQLIEPSGEVHTKLFRYPVGVH